MGHHLLGQLLAALLFLAVGAVVLQPVQRDHQRAGMELRQMRWLQFEHRDEKFAG